MKKLAGYIVVLIIVVLLAWLLWMSVGAFASFFKGATDTVKAASIAAFVSVITFLFGRYFEQRRELKQKINLEKIEVYREFFDFFFDVFSYEKIHGKPKLEQDLVKEMLEFQKKLILWGSDSVIEGYIEFKERLTESEALEDDATEKVALMMTAGAKLLNAMRKDIGYSFTRFSAKDLATLQLSIDPETKKIFDKL